MRHGSVQQDILLKHLRATTSHPTASRLYDWVREEIPNVSLGTVYRNLDKLQKSNEIMGFDAGDGTIHYDGNAAPHPHFCCKICKKVYDFDLSDTEVLTIEAEKKYECKVEKQMLLFYGICKECL